MKLISNTPQIIDEISFAIYHDFNARGKIIFDMIKCRKNKGYREFFTKESREI